MELGEREGQVPGSTHNFNIVHFLASSTKRKGKLAFKQPIWLVQKPRRVKVTMFGRKAHTSLWFLLCPYCCSQSGHGKTPEGRVGLWLPPGVVNTSYQVQSHSRLLNVLLVRQTEPYRSASARGRKWHHGQVYGLEEDEKHIWKIQLYTPLLSGYVLSSKLSAFVAYFT